MLNQLFQFLVKATDHMKNIVNFINFSFFNLRETFT